MRIRIDRDGWEEIFDSLSRNRTRTLLTAFGIFWGIFMLILLMGGGKGLETFLGNELAGFASNSGFLFSDVTSKPYKGMRSGRYWRIQQQDVQRVKNCIGEVDIVTPVYQRWGSTAVSGNHTSSASVQGIHADYNLVDDPRICHGRALNEMDSRAGRKVCVVGTRVVEELFPMLGKNGNPCGRFLQLDGVYYRIVGVSGKNEGGLSIGGNPARKVSLPFGTMQKTYNKGHDVDMLCLTARDKYKMSDVQARVETLLKRVHTIHPDDTQAIVKVNTEALFGMIYSLFNGVSILVWMIGLGTLFAGAVGVSNIMVVTVRERTTEIGIRRAIGATPLDILTMVMIESITLTLLAGMSGIVLAVLILEGIETAVSSSAPDTHFQIHFAVAVGAASLLTLLGVISGLTPALRAMQIKPVDAMREE